MKLSSVTDYYDSLCAILTLCIRLSSGCYVSVVSRVVTYVLLVGAVGNEVEMRNCLLDEFLDSKSCRVTDTEADVRSSLIITLSVICSFDSSILCVRAHLFDAPPVPHPSIRCVRILFFNAVFMLSKMHMHYTIEKFEVGKL